MDDPEGPATGEEKEDADEREREAHKREHRNPPDEGPHQEAQEPIACEGEILRGWGRRFDRSGGRERPCRVVAALRSQRPRRRDVGNKPSRKPSPQPTNSLALPT